MNQLLKFRGLSPWIHINGSRTVGLQRFYCRVAALMPKKSHYEVLGLTRSATKSEIRYAFLKLSKQFHPDKYSSKEESSSKEHHKKFVQINEAYSVLIKPLSRRDYDLTLDAERYMSNQMRSPAYRTHTYTSRSEAGHTYYRNIYNETYWNEGSKEKPFNPLSDIFYVTMTVTSLIVASIFYLMYSYIEDPKVKKFCAKLSQDQIDKYELIMTSQHEGTTVYYYAMPKENDPNSFDVLTVKRDTIEGSNLGVLSELTNVYGNKEDS